MWAETVHVELADSGQVVWRGEVDVLEVFGSADATCCYVWTEGIPGSDRATVYAVLDQGGVGCPEDAVRQSLRRKSV